MMLGAVSEQFESAGMGPGTISIPGDDPGGKSYGIHQLSNDTLEMYLHDSAFVFVFQPPTLEFDNEWKKVARTYPDEFSLDQRLFTTKNLYLPNIVYARSLGFDTWSRKIQESVYSIAVQHGRAREIIRQSFVPRSNVDDQVRVLYAVRSEYVRNLKLSRSILRALLDRYEREIQVVLSIAESDYGRRQ